MLKSEEGLNDECKEFKSDFVGTGGVTTPDWVSVESLKNDLTTYEDGKFTTDIKGKDW